MENLFASVEAQCALFEKRNHERNWGFNEDVLRQIRAEAPTEVLGALCAHVLEVHLETLERTFDEACGCIREGVPVSKFHYGSIVTERGARDSEKETRMRSLCGTYPGHEVRWKKIDLGSCREESPMALQAQNPDRCPGLGILWLASTSPDWVTGMGKNEIPYVWLPGILVSNLWARNSGLEGWVSSPEIGIRDTKKYGIKCGIGLRDYFRKEVVPGYAVPQYI